MNHRQRSLEELTAEFAGHADRLSGIVDGLDDRVQMPDLSDDSPLGDIPELGAADEAPSGGLADLADSFSEAPQGMPELPTLPDVTEGPDEGLEMPALGDSPDYPLHESAPEPTARQQDTPDDGSLQFSQWREQDGSIVFEDGEAEQPEQTAAPERTALDDLEVDSLPLDGTGDLYGRLEGITAAIDGLGGKGGAPSQQGLNLPMGPQGLPWQGDAGPQMPEQSETYAAGSPSIIDGTTLSGARGAGGHGYGSRPRVPGIDLTEPGKRLA